MRRVHSVRCSSIILSGVYSYLWIVSLRRNVAKIGECGGHVVKIGMDMGNAEEVFSTAERQRALSLSREIR